MNMVVCRHPDGNGRFIFKVPEDICIDAGTLLHVETKRGIQPAQAVTASFHADPDVVCPLWGTQPKMMKRVVSFLYEALLEWPEEDIQEKAFVDEDDEP